jgi:N-acyl-D-amino-acid deacylase
MYDLLITNGLIIDGTGSAPYRADVAVSQGNIVAIGSLPDTAQRTLDAAGLVVAPGFIDLHTHRYYACPLISSMGRCW